MALELNTAGVEFVKNVLILYRSGKYFREKEILAKKLVDCAVEAGHLITTAATCDHTKQSDAAKTAVEQLDRTLFVLKVMGAESIYSERRIKPVRETGEKIKDLLLPLIHEEPVVHPVAEERAPAVINANNARFSLPPVSDDGFNEIYEGKFLK